MHQRFQTSFQIKGNFMLNKILLIIFLISPLLAFANMPETECYELQSEVYKFADSGDTKNTKDIKKLYDLSTKLTEECGYLMAQDALKKRRNYNYILYKKLNGQ
jgi:hypothetical protein